MRLDRIERNIESVTHGRYLVEAPAQGLPLLVCFHGYAESAEVQLERVRRVEGSDRWILVAIQGLHRFYRSRTNDVVASWMTRQDRELAISDNIAYVSTVIGSVSREWSANGPLVLAGFSQGVAMAFRCAVNMDRPVSGVIALAGDVPPELNSGALARVPDVLIGRGRRDEWYTPEKAAVDRKRLDAAGVSVEVAVFDGGHEWTSEFSDAVARFLAAKH